MARVWVRVRAPFAAFRHMTAGVYRTTAPTITPSAAYGLLLNIAAIDVRVPAADGPTGLRPDAPALRICTGFVEAAEVSSLYQQLHTYPVGNSGKAHAQRTFGNKHWIAPARREVLVGLDVVLGVEGQPGVIERIVRGAHGELHEERWGLLFAGDNNFLVDRLEVGEEPWAAHWLTPVGPDEVPRPMSGRYTVAIDRADSSQTRSALLAPTVERLASPPEASWVWTPAAPE